MDSRLRILSKNKLYWTWIIASKFVKVISETEKLCSLDSKITF